MPGNSDIQQAVTRLKSGGVVAFPTETVYGLGADAGNPAAVRRIFNIKGRPADHPLIVHIADASQMSDWAREIPPAAGTLARRFWPGPLTLILRRGRAPLEVTGGQDSVGLRVPGHPVALELLKAFGGGVAAPSANRFGRVSPTTAEHVRQELGDAVDLILEGGNCEVGLESTILSLVDDDPVLLRPGSISRSALEAALGRKVSSRAHRSDVRASGTLDSHYAPETRVELCPAAQLDSRIHALAAKGIGMALMHLTDAALLVHNHPRVQPCPMPPDAENYGRALYATLRRLDQAGVDLILVELPPSTEAWTAVNDRLRRASHRV
jgi:L-threonylcarbamoyladenylate synthase